MSTKVVQQSEGRNAAARLQPLKSKLPSALLRKITTKFKPPSPQPKSPCPDIPSPPLSPPIQSPTRRSAVPVAPTDAAAVQRRQVALQRCGLVPLRKDLSKREEELDEKFSRLATLPEDPPERGELTTAEKIMREWQAKNDTRSGKQGDDVDPKVPNDVTSGFLYPAHACESDSIRNAKERKALRVTTTTPSQTSLSPSTPVSFYSIPEAYLFPDIPEEDVTASRIEKKLPPTPFTEPNDPLSIPLPDSPLSSSADLPELPTTPSPRESKRPPPIVVNLTTNDPEEITEEVTHGRSPNRHSVHSLTTKSSLPTLSPTMTASSFSSIPTPQDDVSNETRSPRLGKVSEACCDSTDPNVVYETIPESPELAATEPRAWNPNRESIDTMGTAGFEAFVEKREKRTQPNKRTSGLKHGRSAASDLSLGWSAIADDFSLVPLDGGMSRSSSLPPTPTSTDDSREPTPMQSQTSIEQTRSRIARSKSVIASLGIKVTRRVAPRPTMPTLLPPPSPTRQSTVKIVHDRETLIQGVEGIQDEESRRLTGMAFMDF